MPKPILCVIHINGSQEFLRCLLVVNELSFWYHTCIQYFVPTYKMGHRWETEGLRMKTIPRLWPCSQIMPRPRPKTMLESKVKTVQKLKSRQILMTTTLESSYWVKQIPLNPDLCILPLLEVPIQDSTGETLPTDPDSFQHTVTTELVDNQMVLHDA